MSRHTIICPCCGNTEFIEARRTVTIQRCTVHIERPDDRDSLGEVVTEYHDTASEVDNEGADNTLHIVCPVCSHSWANKGQLIDHTQQAPYDATWAVATRHALGSDDVAYLVMNHEGHYLTRTSTSGPWRRTNAAPFAAVFDTALDADIALTQYRNGVNLTLITNRRN